MKRYYFDHNATTPLAEKVIETMADDLRSSFGNPSSVHQEGQAARHRLEEARRKVARTIGAKSGEIIFTSGGTEANNLALFGIARNQKASGRQHVITTAVEHPSVLEPCRGLEREGVDVTFLPVNRNGIVDPEDLRRSIRPNTCLISVMHANNESGTIEPIAAMTEIVQSVRQRGQELYFHCDGVQALGRVPIDVTSLGVDLYSVSAHKVYGPKGAGALFVRKGVPLTALQLGGRQEKRRRPGTENTPSAAAFAKALELLDPITEFERLKRLRDAFEIKILSDLEGIAVNAAAAERLPNTSSVYFEGIDGEALVIALDLRGFAVSSGSACSSGSIEPSHVLLAMGCSDTEARSCLRFSMGGRNAMEDVNDLASAVIASVRQLRAARAGTKMRKSEYASV